VTWTFCGTELPAASLEQIRRRVEIAALQQQDRNLHATARAIERKAGVIAAPPGELHQDVLASAHEFLILRAHIDHQSLIDPAEQDH